MFLVFFSISLLLQAASRHEQGTLESDASISLAVTDSAHTARQSILRREQSGSSHANPGAACSTNQVSYAVLSNHDLAVIDMGPNTMSGKSEVRRLTAASKYGTFREDHPIQTRMHVTSSRNNNGEWTFLPDGADNLLAVNSGVTASNKTEVHRLKFDSNSPYQEFDVNVVTALPRRTAFDEWDFLLDSQNNLMVIKKGPSTPSSMTEVQKLAAAQSWQQFTLKTATGLPLSASTNNHGDWAFLLDGADNLLCIRRPTPTDSSIEVKRLTAKSNYQTFDISDGGTVLPHDTASGDVHWAFEMDQSDDLLCIKEGPSTNEGFTEIHKLSMDSGYKSFSLHQTRTGAPCRQAFFTDAGNTR